MKGAWTPSKTLRGTAPKAVDATTWEVAIPANDAAVFM
jgi:hypothetical protein